MEPRISLITLGVNDLDTAIHFYKDGLGLPLSKHSGGDVAFFELQGTWLGLYPRSLLAQDAKQIDTTMGFSGITLAHNLTSKGAVDQLLAQAASAGATIAKAAQDTDWGGYSGYFKDPDGHLWEVAYNPHFWIG